jgi:dTDP-4-amino-4,6-dideoxygalactose transaminase
MTISFIDIKALHKDLNSEFKTVFDEVLTSNSFILGKFLKEFESNFSEYLNVKHVIGVNSGTDALILALRAAKIEPGDEVILPALSFFGSLEPILLLHAKPVFVDVNPETALIDTKQIAGKITKKTKAIMPVHLYGQPADMTPIIEIAKEHELSVIEDACQAHGSLYQGKQCGTLGDFGCFSFYPSKNLGALGDGGALVTNNQELATDVTKLRNHGSFNKLSHDLIGYNSRLDDMQAAFLTIKLARLNEWNAQRRKLAAHYLESLKGIDAITPIKQREGNESNFHQFVIKINPDLRAGLQEAFEKEDIHSRVYYPTPLHKMPATKHITNESFPNAEALCQSVISLPLHPCMDTNQVDQVIDVIKKFT